VVFIGDPAQLAPVKATSTPVFDAGFTGAALTTVVRQAEGNPIVDLSTKFRNTVNTSQWFPFTPDGHHVQRMDRDAFNAAIEKEFTRLDWRYADSKILAWTNKCVIAFNQYVRNMAKGDPHFQVMDYAVCNSFLQIGKNSIKTDALVQITGIEPDCLHHDVPGNWVMMDYTIRAFQPKSLAEKNARIKQARAANHLSLVAEIETAWVDLRGAYACTINKAQGSTFGSVFIDLDDVGRCNSGDQLARMMYVGVSRARNHVYLTGDFA
jgi:UvrD-like helicase C-terminal domain